MEAIALRVEAIATRSANFIKLGHSPEEWPRGLEGWGVSFNAV